jgi:superfamily II DNA or RNA helicase
MSHAARNDRAAALLTGLGKTAFSFQTDVAARCVQAVRGRRDPGRILVQSPTGTGKTLISHLCIALLADELRGRPPRALVVVPTRALLAQHAADAAWLRSLDLAVNALGPDLPALLYMRMLDSFGVMITTPVTLRNRTQMLGEDLIRSLDCVIFDEIDTYLTVDELDPRQDIGPALGLCLRQRVPIIGFTGTHLTPTQLDVWTAGGFTPLQPSIDEGWMPLTRTRFESVRDAGVIRRDSEIRDRIGRLFKELTDVYGPTSWSLVKKLAKHGDDTAIRLLREMTGRLKLFESNGTTGAKYRAVVDTASQPGPTLVLTRYVHSARAIAAELSAAGIETAQVDGTMSRALIEAGTAGFRARAEDARCSLVLTRDLGGRGLDFPRAARVILISPRSNHQTVAQELARIRSRRSNPKDALVFYYDRTEEAVKAHRLAVALAADRYGEHHLFDISERPPEGVLSDFESRNLRNEESLDLATDPVKTPE